VLLKDNWISGLVRPFTLVDTILTQQGFKRYGKSESPTYQLTIQDSVTLCEYSLKIPTILEIPPQTNEVPKSVLGKPSLRKRTSTEKFKVQNKIPDSIRTAVESKLAEVADYLQSKKG
jgi:hypothetical protein